MAARINPMPEPGSLHSKRFPGESAAYREARDKLPTDVALIGVRN